MKKHLRRILLLSFIAAVIPSCEFLEDCKKCRIVKDENGVVTNGVPITYCGDKLAEIEGETPQTIGNTTTYWDCQ